MKIINRLVVFTAITFTGLSLAEDTVYEIQYDAWKIKYNCDKRGYEWFEYKTVTDTGSLERYHPFHQERSLPEECRQFSTGSYKGQYNHPELGIQKYDRGHGVHQNIFDHREDLMKHSNLMSNIVPQESRLNRNGLWRYIEQVTECARDKEDLIVWGGVIWGDNSDNDVNLESHGVVTPDYLWKVIEYTDGHVDAWIMPNDNRPKRREAEKYLVSVHEIEKKTGHSINAHNKYLKSKSHRKLIKCSYE
ncbi:hypothetical protein A3715_18315 [Oleiphilus sp. HI0009]|nr:hypothetical protein A3715_18315 [Oleiphilus sp. HI0009]